MGHIILKHIQNQLLEISFWILVQFHCCIFASLPFISKCKLSDCIVTFCTADTSICGAFHGFFSKRLCCPLKAVQKLLVENLKISCSRLHHSATPHVPPLHLWAVSQWKCYHSECRDGVFCWGAAQRLGDGEVSFPGMLPVEVWSYWDQQGRRQGEGSSRNLAATKRCARILQPCLGSLQLEVKYIDDIASWRGQLRLHHCSERLSFKRVIGDLIQVCSISYFIYSVRLFMLLLISYAYFFLVKTGKKVFNI